MKTQSSYDGFVKALKKGSREEYGFEVPKIHKSKKEYTRKPKHKSNYIDE